MPGQYTSSCTYHALFISTQCLHVAPHMGWVDHKRPSLASTTISSVTNRAILRDVGTPSPIRRPDMNHLHSLAGIDRSALRARPTQTWFSSRGSNGLQGTGNVSALGYVCVHPKGRSQHIDRWSLCSTVAATSSRPRMAQHAKLSRHSQSQCLPDH